MTRRPASSIMASPLLIGAITVLITLVAVFLAYNANAGLPFVPTYDVNAELPSGANLVVGNEVRVGGFRVGTVDRIEPRTKGVGGRPTGIAVVHLRLDKAVEPLPSDTRFVVRPRSVLGLKYVELTPGSAPTKIPPGGTVELDPGDRPPIEYDEVLSMFDAATRDNAQAVTSGFGDALAGRGPSINAAIAEFRPLFVHLTPVMRTLSEPSTGLGRFIREISKTSGQLAPVAEVQAELFANMADTFAAFGRDPDALQDTLEKAPPTLDVSIASLRVQRPFVVDTSDLSRRLRPAAQELPRSAPAITGALRRGRSVLPRSEALNERTEDVFDELDRLAAAPTTQQALDDLDDLTASTRPLIEHVAPFQTVCNYANYYFNGLSGVFSAGVPGGSAFNSLLNSSNRSQDNRVSDFPSDRPADVPVELDSQNARTRTDDPLTKNLTQPYPPAIDAEGNADCQAGQWGYIEQWFDGKAEPATSSPDFDTAQSGASSTVMNPDTPGSAGPTFTGVPSLQAVP